MKKCMLILLLVFSFTVVNYAQVVDESDETHTYVETMPEYPGGEEALFKYLSKNIKYPPEAYKNNIGGKVIIEFIVGRDGWVRDVKVIKGIGYGCDEEAVRVVQGMEQWKPGTQNGKNVSVSYKLPIKFTPDQKKTKNKN